MSFKCCSPDAQKYFDSLDEKRVRNIKKHLKELLNDPYEPRSGCEIDIIEASGFPPMRRQRNRQNTAQSIS